MQNLLQETLEDIYAAEKLPSDVLFVLVCQGSSRVSWEAFEACARSVSYRSDVGIDDALILVGRGEVVPWDTLGLSDEIAMATWWLERDWRDGIQAWVFCEGSLRLSSSLTELESVTPSQLRT